MGAQTSAQMSQQSPLLLALESSGSVCSVALARRHESSVQLVAQHTFFQPNLHDNLLAFTTGYLLDQLGYSLDDVSAVCVNAGPGSFTGLRIGAAFAKALCAEELLPATTITQPAPHLVAVPSLEALACAARQTAQMLGSNTIVAATVSHKNLAYCQRFTAQGEPLTAPELLERETILPEERTLYCGTLFAPETLRTFAPEQHLYTVLPHFTRLSAEWIALRGAELASKAAFADAATFVPLYVQEFVPKIALRS